MSDEHPYLGTSLSPREYYEQEADRYSNPHAPGIARLLDQVGHHLHGRVLDLGCGDGLATKLLAGRGLDFVGADNAPRMIARYEAETGRPGHVAGFADPLPPCDSVISIYAMHLAASGEVPLMWYRLWEAGADRVVVVTPLKERPAPPEHYFKRIEAVSGPYGPDDKTIHGHIYARGDG